MRGYRLQQATQIAHKIFNAPNYWGAKYIDPKDIGIILGILRKTRKRCSCWMCGHRRRYEGLTIQERRKYGVTSSLNISSFFGILDNPDEQ